jgi:uncharacterized membrane protein YdbT with pleckstrin-like domain
MGSCQRTPICETPPTAMVEANAAADDAVYDAEETVPAHLLDGGEIVVLTLKPSLWFILFKSFRMLLGTGLIVVLSAPLSRALYPIGMTQPLLVKAAIVLAVARLMISTLQWVSRLYVLTNRRVMRIRGVFNVDIFECQLTRIQNTLLHLAIYERLFGLGSIGFATAGTGGIEATWENLNHPMEVHERVRAAIRQAHNHDRDGGV